MNGVSPALIIAFMCCWVMGGISAANGPHNDKTNEKRTHCPTHLENNRSSKTVVSVCSDAEGENCSCYGVKIAKDVFLSAASCIFNAREAGVKIPLVKRKMGDLYIHETHRGTNRQRRSSVKFVKKRLHHNSYDKLSCSNRSCTKMYRKDLALLFTSIKEKVNTACTAETSACPDRQRCFAYTKYSGFQRVNVGKCNSTYLYKRDYGCVNPTIICTETNMALPKGSPVYCRADDRRYYLRGVVSMKRKDGKAVLIANVHKREIAQIKMNIEKPN